jgi:oligoribonuclease NrnB/cAMP/cGMP phosphodiesterase (DHH superfamily)
MICIYHSKDLDGFCSGAIVKLKYPEAKLIGYDYGQDFPWHEIPAGEPVIMIDVSLPMENMLELAKHSNFQFTWIDHHISAINDFNKFSETHENFLTPVLENGISACEGGWLHLFPIDRMPMAVRLLGEYDTWRNAEKERWDHYVMPFQYGMRMKCQSAETFPMEVLKQNHDEDLSFSAVNEIIVVGNAILEYQKTQNERACKSCAFETEFEGLRAVCLNNGGANSSLFDSVWNTEVHDIMIPFVFTGKYWTFSIYSTKPEIDCSVIAKRYGGGGHKQAAGFQLKELPDEFKIHIK